jgi:hypothetical protein
MAPLPRPTMVLRDNMEGKMAFEMEGGRVYKCRHLMISKGMNGHCETDLILIQGTPNLVLEWNVTPHGDTPAVTIPVSAALLHPLPGWKNVDCMLEGGAVQDPRDTH